MGCKQQLEIARRENTGLNRKIKELEATLLKSTEQKSDPRILEPSSIEFYLGLAISICLAVFAMTYLIRIPLFLVLIFISTDLSWRSPWTHRWPMFVKVPIAIAIVGILGYLGFVNTIGAYHEQEFPRQQYIMAWGPDPFTAITFPGEQGKPPYITGTPQSRITVDTEKLSRYAGRYRLLAVCFHSNGLSDLKDSPISKSNLFDIEDYPKSLTIEIPWSQKFSAESLSGFIGTNYSLLLIPKKITSVDSFATIRDVLDKKGILLQTTSGGP